MSINKARSKYQKYSYLVAIPALVVTLAACQIQTQRQAELQKQSEKMFYESDLRAFCPPVTLADGGYFYNIYGKGARSSDNLVYQAAISDITRDCRYDHKNNLINMQIAAAGRIVSGSNGAQQSLNLPIVIKILNGDKVLYSKTYKQDISLQQSGGVTQFLFSEKVTLKQDEVEKGTKIIIGFAPTAQTSNKNSSTKLVVKSSASDTGSSEKNAQIAPQAKKKNNLSTPSADRLSPHSGSIMIPESW